MIKYRVERKRAALRVVLDLELGEALAHRDDDAYLGRLETRLREIFLDIVDVLHIIGAESETGVVRWFDEVKGYGFIVDQDRQDVFVHYSKVVGDGFKTLQAGQPVRFKRRVVAERVEAIEVEPLDKPAEGV